MFRGVIALFKSRIIFSPFVLLGVICGSYFYKKFEFEQIVLEYGKYQLYLLVIILATMYHLLFKKHLQAGGYGIDWITTFLSILGSVTQFFIVSLLTISFLYMIVF